MSARRSDGDGANHRAGSAQNPQRPDNRAPEAHAIARQLVEDEDLNLVHAVPRQVAVVDGEGKVRRRVRRGRDRIGERV